jgi:endo-1,4-beta-xylanase
MLQYATLALLLTSLVTGHAVSKRQAQVSVNEKFTSHGKTYFGVCSDQNRLTSGTNANIIAADFGQVTPENSMKWDSIERRVLLPQQLASL